MQSLYNSTMRSIAHTRFSTAGATGCAPTRGLLPQHTARRHVAAAAAAAEEYYAAPSAAAGSDFEGGYGQQQQQQQQQPQQWQDRPQRGRGGGRGQRGGGGRGGGRGGYNQRYNNGPRGEVTYDEESGEENGGGYRGGRGGGGYGRGGRGGGTGRGGGQYKQRRVLSPEAQAVNDTLANATGWRQLQAVLEQQSRPGMPGLDAFQLVEVLMRLTRVDTPRGGDDAADYQQFVASVYGWILNRLPTFRPRQFANTVFAIGKLNLYNEELMGALLQAMLPELPRFNAFEYSRFLDGLQRLNMAPPAEFTESFFSPETAQAIVASSTRNELGVILSLCQRLCLAPPPEWLAVVSEAALAHLSANRDQMLAADVARLVSGLAGLGWKPTPEQWEGLVDVTGAQLPTGFMRARGLVELAWAFSQWGNAMPAQWGQAFNYQLYRQTGYLTPSDVGSVLYSLAYIRAPPNPGQLQRLLRDFNARVDSASGDDLANVVMALVQFSYKPTDVLFDDMLIELQKRLGTCSANGLNNIITALPALGNGIRLQQVVSQAVARYDALMAQQPYGEGEAAAPAAAYEAQEAAAAAPAEAAAQQQESEAGAAQPVA